FPQHFTARHLRHAVVTIAHYEKPGGQYNRAAIWLATSPAGRLVRQEAMERHDPTESATNPAFLTIN
ncbi:MAG TPA: hypothetical protein VMR25_14595, partial [Planctomycetaceae bacterium]|nr:hypothetical protein [Planctomycetaceae bacterium]